MSAFAEYAPEYLLFFVFSVFFRIPAHLVKRGIENVRCSAVKRVSKVIL